MKTQAWLLITWIALLVGFLIGLFWNNDQSALIAEYRMLIEELTAKLRQHGVKLE